jgi:hypothetical protein
VKRRWVPTACLSCLRAGGAGGGGGGGGGGGSPVDDPPYVCAVCRALALASVSRFPPPEIWAGSSCEDILPRCGLHCVIVVAIWVIRIKVT